MQILKHSIDSHNFLYSFLFLCLFLSCNLRKIISLAHSWYDIGVTWTKFLWKNLIYLFHYLPRADSLGQELVKHKMLFFTVILDSSGYTKGYGFVRFGSEDEQRNALYAMNGYTGLGLKPLKICTAVPKPKGVLPQNPNNAANSSNGYNNGAV